jgi:hypothetical protein
LCSDTAIISP